MFVHENLNERVIIATVKLRMLIETRTIREKDEKILETNHVRIFTSRTAKDGAKQIWGKVGDAGNGKCGLKWR